MDHSKRFALMAVLALGSALGLAPAAARAHCQVPCGIYDDAARIHRLYEDVTTIAKGMAQIAELAGKADPQSANQLTRWIMNKDEHASAIITTVAEYFLTQKVKPVTAGAEGYQAYLTTLADHHAVMTAAMKCKQKTDPKTVEELRAAIAGLARHYDTEHRH